MNDWNMYVYHFLKSITFEYKNNDEQSWIAKSIGKKTFLLLCFLQHLFGKITYKKPYGRECRYLELNA